MTSWPINMIAISSANFISSNHLVTFCMATTHSPSLKGNVNSFKLHLDMVSPPWVDFIYQYIVTNCHVISKYFFKPFCCISHFQLKMLCDVTKHHFLIDPFYTCQKTLRLHWSNNFAVHMVSDQKHICARKLWRLVFLGAVPIALVMFKWKYEWI